MVEIKHMRLRLSVNTMLKKGMSFDQILTHEDVLGEWSDFLSSKIGTIWLKSQNGKKFNEWNER